VMVTDAVTFQQDWQELRPGESVPQVDFTAQVVVFLQAGQEPTAGYSIRISSLEEKTDQLVVHYKVESPAAAEAQVITHPWSMQVIPKPSEPVIFQKDP
ncbi:MAG TPA: protease complex subunit PrcB family protein, partial [bacterium]|nr:protease complex subunit PrcB family protein [bacterium]